MLNSCKDFVLKHKNIESREEVVERESKKIESREVVVLRRCTTNCLLHNEKIDYHKARLNLFKPEHDTSALESENENFGQLKQKKIVSDISEGNEDLSDTNISLLSASTPLPSSITNRVQKVMLMPKTQQAKDTISEILSCRIKKSI
ncbi:uncharacterized protein LOC124816421 isoform X1 [Hydra vulgaris]|uniref:uncharacterized protein LOC124816421 isoform X1 n=1 Tax=Hydra vulgaris TaxID=6087 RepID=UPI001F5F6995|nr:uncharacterized protein LOC124816421 isoform X1 [Hydra vulgaris]